MSNVSDTIWNTLTSSEMEKRHKKLVRVSNFDKLKRLLWSLFGIHSSFHGDMIRRRLVSSSSFLRNISPAVSSYSAAASSVATPPIMEDLLSKLATFAFLISMIKHLLPKRFSEIIKNFLSRISIKFHENVEITFHEYMTNAMYNEAYNNVKSYLATKSSNSEAYQLQAEMSTKSKSLVLSLDRGEEIIDVFEGIEFNWRAHKEKINSTSSKSPSVEKNSFVLTLHKKDKDFVERKYLNYVMKQGKEMEVRNNRRKLYTNKSYSQSWSNIDFEHPATFDNIAMEPNKKQEIINDLIAFREGKEYYASIGKAWKRGYLLYGPPGTGKSTMISAIANYLDYDIYDLELTSVRDNSELKNLLIVTRAKSIIVIEDIDCSMGQSGKRKVKSTEKKDNDVEQMDVDSNVKKNKNVTLSGILNFIDGIWSVCGQEKIIIFTTNHVENLDPALIRRGRMDMHIEMSYCRYEAFKVLAKNYLGIDEHCLFGEIEDLLQQVDISPCDVAENLMPKTIPKDVEVCLKSLIQACMVAKEKAKLKNKLKNKGKKSSSQMPQQIQQVEDITNSELKELV